jgi:hypothetical protein
MSRKRREDLLKMRLRKLYIYMYIYISGSKDNSHSDERKTSTLRFANPVIATKFNTEDETKEKSSISTEMTSAYYLEKDLQLHFPNA